MSDTLDQKQMDILGEMETHLQAIKELVKRHGQQKHLQKRLRGQDDNKCDERAKSCSFSIIPGLIETIHQVINVEKAHMQSNKSSLDQKSLANPPKNVVEDSSMDKALKNSVVLRTIMNNLHAPDLLRCRFVTKSWNDEATLQLLSGRTDNIIEFKWDEEQFKFRNKVGTLEELRERCFRDPLGKFPCSQFSFDEVMISGEVRESPADFSNFLFQYGHNITSLSLYSSSSSTAALNIIRKILFEWTPRLKSLTLMGEFVNEEPPTTKNSVVSLCRLSLENLELHSDTTIRQESLTSISLQRWAPLVQDILTWAPNIKKIVDNQLLFTKVIFLAGKIGAVHRLTWTSNYSYMRTRYIEFSQYGPKLTVLKVDLLFSDQNNFLENLLLILEASRETLKILEFKGRPDLIDGTDQMDFFPVMENLQEFRISMWGELDDGEGKILPRGFPLKTAFPRLKTLRLEDVGEDPANEGLDNPFGYECNSSTTVEKLFIHTTISLEQHFQASWLGQAHDLYPNVRVLDLDWCGSMKGIHDILQTIWTSWKESLLEELTVTNLDLDNGDHAEIIDQAFTGFDKQTVQTLRKQSGLCLCEGKQNSSVEFERGPSILDLKKLKLLKLGEYVGDSSTDRGVFSRVSVIHAFEPMRKRQGLKVMVNGVDLDKMVHHGLYLDFSMCREDLEKKTEDHDLETD